LQKNNKLISENTTFTLCLQIFTLSSIAINTRFLLKNKLEGIGNYTYEITKRLVLNHSEHTFYLLFDRAFDESYIFAKNVVPVKIHPQARHPILWFAWFEYYLPKYLQQIQPSVFFSPDGFCSLRTKTPQIMTTHDLAFEHYPEFVPSLVKNYYKFFVPKFHQKANKIIAISEATKNDIIQQYKVESSKIKTIYNGVNSNFKPLPNQIIEQTKAKYSKGFDYFLFVGACHPRKNITRLLLAFDTFKNEVNSTIKLLIVGREAWQNETMRKTYENMHFKSEVIFTGHLSEHEVKNIMAAAFSLCYVSLYEGFGLPIVEAFAAEIPVITSNISSMPEIAKDAALLVNPNETSEIKNAMMLYYTNDLLRNTMIAKGKKNASEYSWDNCAADVWKEIEEFI
jgi:glycosyltransferase involved in cell wall biosynthesis